MNGNLELITRGAERSMKIYKDGTDGALVAAGPALEAAVKAYSEADRVARLTATEERKQRAEREEMKQRFGREYNKTRSSILARMPYADLPSRASQMATPDDLLNSSRQTLELLMKVAGVDETHPLTGEGEAAPTGEGWAIQLAKEFQASYDAAKVDLNEAIDMSGLLQKAQADRAEKRLALEGALLRFRRLVKDVYGPQSREYHRLRIRGERENGDEEAPVVTPPTPEPQPVAA